MVYTKLGERRPPARFLGRDEQDLSLGLKGEGGDSISRVRLLQPGEGGVDEFQFELVDGIVGFFAGEFGHFVEEGVKLLFEFFEFPSFPSLPVGPQERFVERTGFSCQQLPQL